MTFRVHKVCAVCGKPETARRRLVTIAELLGVQSFVVPPDNIMPQYESQARDTARALRETYCLNRRCVVRGVFELAMAKLKERQGRV